MALCAQAERLEALQEEERSERVHGGTHVAEDVEADLDGEHGAAEGLDEAQAVVPLSRLCEVGELP